MTMSQQGFNGTVVYLSICFLFRDVKNPSLWLYSSTNSMSSSLTSKSLSLGASGKGAAFACAAQITVKFLVLIVL